GGIGMSKERLEEIKAGLSHDYIHGNDFPISLGFIDLEWLIKQAEKADRPQNNLIEEMEKVDFLHEKLIEIKKQNKRYREALSLLNRVAAADYKSYIDTDANFVVDVTSEALEGGSDE